LIEHHEPDTRGIDIFFYKLDRIPVEDYLAYELPSEERLLPERRGCFRHHLRGSRH
jgi:hypothetical protein